MGGCASWGYPDARDARITADVKARLAEYPELQPPNSLDVQTLHQVVYLRGLMGTPFQISLASSVASQVPGVRRIENLISLEDAR
jgi:osmotically-inducible protein OsmY